MPAKRSIKKVVKKQPKQTQQKMVDFGTAVNRFWQKYADFNGIAQRSEYWWAVLFLFLIELIFSFLTSAIPFVWILYLIWSLVIIIPGLSLSARRLHDAGFSAVWLVVFWACVLLGLFAFSLILWPIASVTGIFLLIVALLPSKMKNNPYRR